MLKLIFFIGSITQFFTAYISHPHYVGITEIEYVASKNELQIACKWYIDDLEDALKAYGGKKVDISEIVSSVCDDSTVQSYIRTHLKLIVGHKNAELQCVGAELEKGSVWVYWKVNDVLPYDSLSIYNNLFCEVHSDQIHIIHYKVASRKETQKVFCRKPIALFK